MEKERRSDDDISDMDYVSRRMVLVGSSSPSRSLPVSSSPPDTVSAGSNHIVHTVTKFDTLAGVAIKYGVEVADIKRLNGLVTDLQMFALKTLLIPLPGRHPPSPSLCNGHDTPQWSSSSEQTPSNRRHSDIFDSFQSLKLTSSDQKVSPGMNSLQGLYSSKSDQKSSKGYEMDMYRNGGAKYLEDGSFSAPSTNSLSHHRKSKSVANGLMYASSLQDPLLCQESENSSDKWINKLLRRRQKSETDFTSAPPEKLLKEENSGSSAISRGLTLRPKSTTRIVSGVEGESSGQSPFPLNLNEPLPAESAAGVRKSSSTSSLQDSDSGALSSLWPTSKWSLKADFQALSMPMFDGLPKPTNRKNKAALD